MADPYRTVDYRGFVSWPQRLAREWPFLARTFADIPLRRILDLGSGGGEHAAFFAAQGYRVTGVESSPALVEQAKAAVADARATFVAADISRLGDDVAGPFGAAVCLGNTLPNLTDDEQLRRLAQSLRTRLPAGGVVVLQLLNYYRIFASRIRYLAPLFRPDDAGEVVFLRLMDPQPDGRTVVFCPSTFQYDAAADPPLRLLASQRVILRGWRRADIEPVLDRAGFNERQTFGGFDGQPFDPAASSDLVLVAR